jgi:hypothetical protein
VTILSPRTSQYRKNHHSPSCRTFVTAVSLVTSKLNSRSSKPKPIDRHNKLNSGVICETINCFQPGIQIISAVYNVRIPDTLFPLQAAQYRTCTHSWQLGTAYFRTTSKKASAAYQDNLSCTRQIRYGLDTF